MTKQYASMPKFLFKLFGITKHIDSTCFRMHDRDYGTSNRPINGWKIAKTRAEADRNLRNRLIDFGVAKWAAWTIWAGCRVTKFNKYKK